MTCDRGTCSNGDDFHSESISGIVIPSSDEFIANLLQLKCKVFDLVRRQMQKEIPGLQELETSSRLLRGNQGKGTILRAHLEHGQSVEELPLVKRENKVPEHSLHVDHTVASTIPSADPEKLSDTLPTLPKKVRELEKVESIARPASTMEQSANSPGTSSNLENSCFRKIAKFLKDIFSLYWIALAIGILGLVVLAFGIYLGAFMCTNGAHRWSFFYWKRPRMRPVY